MAHYHYYGTRDGSGACIVNNPLEGFSLFPVETGEEYTILQIKYLTP